MAQNIFRGLGVAMVTPFTDGGDVDYAALASIVDYEISAGADFLCILCTTSETPCLIHEERSEVKKTILDVNKGRVPIVMGCGGNNTQAVVSELATADFSGVDGILSVCPYYNKPSQEGLYQHFKAIAAASPLPVVLYNVPGRTGVNMSAQTTVRLATDCDNIVAIKEASGSLPQVEELLKDKPQHFDVLSGDDAMTLEMMARGAQGAISVVGNALPKQVARMIGFASHGDYASARRIDSTFKDLYNLLFVDGNPAGVKALMSEMGLLSNVLRLPLVPASLTTREKMAAVLSKLNV